MNTKFSKKMTLGIAAIAASFTLSSCNYTDPVEYNDTIVTKIDSLVGYQSSFVDALGKEGDTMKAAYDAMNKYTDKTIANISGMPEYSDGAEFNKSVVQILNNLKTTNASSGKNMMELYEKSNAGEEITDADFDRMDKLADEYDKTWEQELKNFDAAQKKYAEKAGITIQQVGKIVN